MFSLYQTMLRQFKRDVINSSSQAKSFSKEQVIFLSPKKIKLMSRTCCSDWSRSRPNSAWSTAPICIVVHWTVRYDICNAEGSTTCSSGNAVRIVLEHASSPSESHCLSTIRTRTCLITASHITWHRMEGHLSYHKVPMCPSILVLLSNLHRQSSHRRTRR